MNDDRDVIHGYSKDKRIYQHKNISDRANTTTTKLNSTSEKYYLKRNCPEILTLYGLTNKKLEERKQRTYQSMTSDINDLGIINYPLQPSSSESTNSNLADDNQNKQNKEPMFPKLTPRSTTTATAKKFPISTPRSTPLYVDDKIPTPAKRTSLQSISSSLKEPLKTEMSIVSTEKKKKIQLSRLE